MSKAVGRPTKYQPEMCEQVVKLCRLGATDKDIAKFFEISEAALNVWKQQHPEFMEALKEGRELADAMVGQRLYERAIGYSHPEDKILQHGGKPIIVPTMKHYPPDSTACIFWLKNRRKDLWRDRHELEHTGKDGEPLELDRLELAKDVAFMLRMGEAELETLH